MTADVELRLPPDVAYVGLARLVVTLAARQAGMADERVEDLRIAVSEATTNAIKAHVENAPDHPVVLTFGMVKDRQFRVSIADAGPGFEPSPPEAFALRDWSLESGLGVTLIRGLADAVDFDRDRGMIVHMRFYIGMDADDAAVPG